MSPSGKVYRSLGAYMTGQTYEDVLRERAEMLDITVEQFKAAADLIDATLAQGYRSAVGNEKKLSDNADMFDNMVSIN